MQDKQTTWHPAHIALLALAILTGATLRLINNDQPFHTSDHAQLASVVTFFYPRNLEALIPSATSSWNLLTNPHGMLPSVIGITFSTLIGIAGMTITEFWWNLPFVLVNLLPIPLAAIIVARVANKRAGLLAAFLLAILPLHTSLSRASGLNIPVALDCHFVTVLAFLNYYQEPTRNHARWAGIALAINLTVEVLFPILFGMVFAIGVLLTNPTKPGILMRIQQTRKRMFDTRVMLLPLLVVFFNFAMLIAYVQGWISFGGLAARLAEGSDRQPGIYPGDFWDNATYAIGTIAFPLLLALGAAGLPALVRFEQRALPLLWSLVYLLPFLIFTRPHVYEYFLFGTAPLTLNAAIVIANWWEQGGLRRWLAAGIYPVLLVLFALRMVSMVFGIDVAPVVGTGQAPGAVLPDQGFKAAAWWVRNHTEPDDLVFADSAFEEYQVWYYMRRPFIAVTDAEYAGEAYEMLDNAERTPELYLVVPGNEDLLRQATDSMPHLQATVYADEQGQPLLHIYGHEEHEQQAPEMIQRQTANRIFDQQFGSWRVMFAIGTRQ
jgi:hypothetical protein